jgi:CubicO group peptidase (beta-lactamase class C family)
MRSLAWMTVPVLARSARRRVLELGLIGYGALTACGPNEPEASPTEIARAKELYTRCVEDELGIEVLALDIQPSGDIEVEFGEGYTEEGGDLAISICEARISPLLEPGGIPVLDPPPNLGHPGSDADLDALLAARTSLGFEGAVLAEFAGERRLSAGFGKLAEGSMRAPDTETAFDCGSIMKEVTATVIFSLEQAGALSREQTLPEFFEGVPSAYRAVTVDQVLTHSAGFAEYHDTEGDFEAMDRDTAIEAIFAEAPRFPPGTESAYSNAGYTLLAALIEQVTGDEYQDVVRERVFEPLHMDRSGFYGEPLWTDGNVAVGRGADVYQSNDPSAWPAPTWALIGNGGLVSTLEDLLKLARAFDGDVLFRPEAREAFRAVRVMQASASIAGKPLIAYAGGNDFGFNAVVGQVSADRTYIAVATHVRSAISAEILGIEVLQTLYGEVLERPQTE